MKRRILFSVLALLLILVIGIGVLALGPSGSYLTRDGKYKPISARKSYSYIVHHPLFNSWGNEVFSWEPAMLERIVSPLNIGYVSMFMGYQKTSVVSGMNFLIDQANEKKLQYIPFYTSQEMNEDISKANSGLFYIPGDFNKPFAVIVAGGAFKCVAMLNESLPVAKQLSEQGYPVFILKYRVNQDGTSEMQAREDTAEAMGYIFANAAQLGITNMAYSMWGFSAGGRLIYEWSESNEFSCSSMGLPAPQLLSLCYAALWDTEGQYPHETKNPNTAVYMCYGKNDGVIGDIGIQWCYEHEKALREYGQSVKFDLFENAPHGYGDGFGTDAEGWVWRALALLEPTAE